MVLRDVVRVIVGKKGVAERLRGLMFDVTAQRKVDMSVQDLRGRQQPSRTALELVKAQ